MNGIRRVLLPVLLAVLVAAIWPVAVVAATEPGLVSAEISRC